MTIRFRSNEHFFFFSFFFLSVGKGSVFQTRGSSMDHPLWGRVKAPFELSIQSRYFQLDTFRNAIIEKIGLIERLDSSIERTFFPRIFRVFRRIRRGQFPLTVNCLEKERNLVLDRSEEKKETLIGHHLSPEQGLISFFFSFFLSYSTRLG